ncbi:Atxe2 family lasso peptide isopeptidase [Novosphingobium sp. TCA1]|uniref:Atxe2 family lasso peptide isopeptidase n=1 Tax=Novosphingobium sp. TCA1 TaxID=2682474 RepID=UPI0013079923|nr:Atxe2 family lasso peptide isopeptidase [Novosphingobium sp. TCA1]GFE76306.1 peptidase S9 [Novosphingobium sp. TCA1]
MVKFSSSLLALAGALCGAGEAHAACDDLLPSAQALRSPELSSAAPSGAPGRAMTTMDLARIRDIGDTEVISNPQSPYALSPDGRSIAFVIARGDPTTNSYCSALVVMARKGGGAPRIIDRGGAIPRLAAVFRDLYIVTGFPDTIVPAWSPDGTAIAYRKEVGGIVQLVAAKTDGSGSRVLTQEGSNVENFTWLPDSGALAYFTRPGRDAARQRIAREARTGWLYDKSILPMQSWEPQPWAKDLARTAFVVELAGPRVRLATPQEERFINPPPAAGAPYELAVRAPNGASAWTAPVSDLPYAKRRVWARVPGGKDIACKLDGCTGKIGRLFWQQDGKSVVFLAREGWNSEDFVLYRWVPSSNRLTTILRTSDALTGCIFAGDELVCGRENAATPRRIMGVDLASGRSRLIFDPNPEFAKLNLGKVTRLKVRSDRGYPAWADLVLPPDYDGRSKLPLVVVQYRSAGFLRGGIGDDYPIFPMAAKGLAVLSFDRPPSVGSQDPSVKTFEQGRAVDWNGWADRKNTLSAIEAGIDAAVATGAIDPERIGISGLSDGASTIEFALINSRRFKAAAMSTCCDDLLTQTVLGGFAWGEEILRRGVPPSVDNDREYWKPISLSVNARKIDTPILMQVADREASLGLPAIGALTEARKPLEVYVFPDEYHNKWQPAHRLAVYDRAIDWFNFWLRDHEDPAPGKREQYARWQELARRAPKGGTSMSP